jgi:hypothetical protein
LRSFSIVGRRWRRNILSGKTTALYAAVLTGDMKTVAAGGIKGLLELATITHAGMTTEEFAKIAADWIASSRHPKFDRLYTEMIHQPMLELLVYLRANGFKTFVVSGGAVDFMRVWVDKVDGIPPEQVIGSSNRNEVRDAGWRASVDAASITEFHERHRRQAGGHRNAHWPQAHCGVWQL